MSLPNPPILVITDRQRAFDSLEAVVAAVLEGGCRWISVREKDLDAAAQRDLLESLRPLIKNHGATLSLHGALNLDPLVKADLIDAVHLPAQSDVAATRAVIGDRLLGVSTHSRDEAEAAAEAGADYVTLSPIFATASKPGYGPLIGLAGLRAVVQAVEIPVLALAGVTVENAADCKAAGAAGLAVMGEVMRAQDPGALLSDLIEHFV